MRTARGNRYAGVSYHTAIMALTMHAEATALAHAAIHGEREIIAITGPNCQACKQLIWESGITAGIDIVVIMAGGRANAARADLGDDALRVARESLGDATRVAIASHASARSRLSMVPR